MSWLKWIKTAANVSTGGVSSLYLYGSLLAAGAALSAGAMLWHGWQVDGVHDAAFKAGQAQVQTRWDKAVEDAKNAQAQQNEAATKTVIQEVEVVRTVYRDRIKEVNTYVPIPGTNCPADADFLRQFNAATSPAGGAPDQ